jgi:CspA family cold shock protein
LEGKIKRIIRDRGFGFILAENGDEIFFYQSDLEEKNFNTLKEGTIVEFNLEKVRKGLLALNIKTKNKKDCTQITKEDLR